MQCEPWGRTPNGKDVDLYTLTNASGTQASIATYGATLVRLLHGDPPADLVLGFDTLDGYLGEHPYFGGTIGRYANRIANGRFTLAGRTFTLARNNGAHALHGGVRGFDKVLWRGRPVTERRDDTVELRYVSANGEEGYPGILSVLVRFTLTADVLRIEYEATTSQPTIVNLTNHSYFNLAGSAGSILDHELTIDAGRFTPIDRGFIPTGEQQDVSGTPFDFRTARRIGVRITEDNEQLRFAGGYDHNFVLNGPPEVMRRAATLQHPASGRVLEVYTTAPGLQLYTGNQLDGTIRGKGGQIYGRHAGVCLETQQFPDAPNQPSFPPAVLRPGQRLRTVTEYRFGRQSPDHPS
jgi:aldose 1-epimerase